MSGGELFEKINEIDHFNETIAAGYMRKILEAVNYCHTRNIVHRYYSKNLVLLIEILNQKIFYLNQRRHILV